MDKSRAQTKNPKIHWLAIALIAGSLLWALTFATYLYAGIVIGVVAVVWFFVVLKRKQDALEDNFRRLFSVDDVRRLDKYAMFKAQRSNGYSQSQGTGYLVLTDEVLYFEMSLLDKVVSIPVTSITRVGETRRLLGVGTIRPMLEVEFEDANGEMDAIALSVKELAAWKVEIARAMSDRG